MNREIQTSNVTFASELCHEYTFKLTRVVMLLVKSPCLGVVNDRIKCYLFSVSQMERVSYCLKEEIFTFSSLHKNLREKKNNYLYTISRIVNPSDPSCMVRSH